MCLNICWERSEWIGIMSVWGPVYIKQFKNSGNGANTVLQRAGQP